MPRWNIPDLPVSRARMRKARAGQRGGAKCYLYVTERESAEGGMSRIVAAVDG